jgi:hypothetical protein
MATRILGPTGGRRRKRMLLLLPVLALAALILAIGAPAAVTDLSLGFEASDANLAANGGTPNFDWNSFSRVSWSSGSAPYRQASKTANTWTFKGIEDDQNSGTDTVFGGGTKQDDACASITSGPKPPNKDDLKRIYIASKTAAAASGDVQAGDIILSLAWERITQNTTSASAHVGFEFNQSGTACTGTGHDGLVQRSSANGGDMLIVYDFEGSSTDAPTLKLLRWRTSGTCEQTGKAATSAGCWVLQESNLIGAGNAVASVFVAPALPASQTVLDALAPPASPSTTSVDQNIGDREFGEAAINLSAAGVFPRGSSGTSCFTLGKGFGVSRSSGDSGTAAMKDIAGPAPLSISNCGTVIVRKVTSPAGGTGFGFTSNVSTDPTDSSAASFSLDDGQSKTISNVLPGSYNVTESIPSTYTLSSIDCSAGTLSPTSTNTGTGVTLFTMSAGKTLDCTYTNTLNKVESSLNTAPWIYPNDKATVGAGTGQIDITGSVKFRLYDTSANCNAVTPSDTVGTGGLLYKETVGLPAAAGTSKNVNTANTSVKVESDTTVYWLVQYLPGSDPNHHGRISQCTESIAATFGNDTSGGTNVP